MNRAEIDTLVGYNFWANRRILDSCKLLSQDEFAGPVSPDPGWGSLRGVLVHILDTEYGWRSVLQGHEDGGILQPSAFPDVSALAERWTQEHDAWKVFLNAFKDTDLHRKPVEGQEGGLNVWQTVLHVVLHGNQHRGEAAWMLTGYGHSPGELDFDRYLQEALPPGETR